MVDVPRGSPRGNKGFARIKKVITDMISNVDTLFIKLASGKGLEIENDAGLTCLEVVEATGVVNVGKLVVGSSAVLPYGHHAGLLIADITAAFADPATLDDGWTGVYKNDTDSKIYLVSVVGDAFYVEELTAAAAA